MLRGQRLTLWDNAEYVERELPNVFLSDEMRERVVKLCALWKETFFDLGGDTSPALLRQWVYETVIETDEVARMLEAAAKADDRYELAHILVAESALNVVRTLNGGPALG